MTGAGAVATTAHRYPRGDVIGDFMRGGLGLAATALPLLLVELAVWVAVVFAGLAALFALFLLRAAERQATVVEAGPQGLAVSGLRGRAIAWDRLSGLRLAYYSTRRDRQRGWMTLTLKDGRRSISLESTLDGFDPLVERAAAAALANGVEFDRTTLANLDAMGIDATADSGDDWGDDPDTDAAAERGRKADWVRVLKDEGAAGDRGADVGGNTR